MTPASEHGDAPPDPRTRPHAVHEIAGMFDDVSGRYDFLNRVMSLGRDASWRRAMWDEVPEDARTVLDLCCGSGASLPGLRRPGRLVLGLDASLGMLGRAATELPQAGWAPRLVCADAFHLPLSSESIDCITVAFGVRNLRPRDTALAEITRVLRPGGRLVVLEATAPGTGLIAPFHGFYVRRVIPLAGRLSPDPSAYAYLSRSILEFGSGAAFESDLARAGFEHVTRRSFMFGATGLWVAERAVATGSGTHGVQRARLGELPRGEMPHGPGAHDGAWRWWAGLQTLLSAAVLASLLYALELFTRAGDRLLLEPWQRTSMRLLFGIAILTFAIRTVLLGLRFLGPPRRR